MNELELAIQTRPVEWGRGAGSVVLHVGTYDVWAYRTGSLYGLGVFKGTRNWQLGGFATPEATLLAGETVASMIVELDPGVDMQAAVQAMRESPARVVRINEV